MKPIFKVYAHNPHIEQPSMIGRIRMSPDERTKAELISLVKESTSYEYSHMEQMTPEEVSATDAVILIYDFYRGQTTIYSVTMTPPQRDEYKAATNKNKKREKV